MKPRIGRINWTRLRWPRHVATIASIGVFLSIVHSGSSAFAEFKWQVNFTWLLLSLIPLLTAFLTGALGWSVILRLIGIQVPLTTVVRIWLISQLGKYLPGGTVWYTASRIVLSAEVGITASQTVKGILLETVFLIVGGATFFLLSLTVGWQRNSLSLALSATSVVLVSLVLLWPPVFAFVTRNVYRVVGLEYEAALLKPRDLFLIAAYYTGQWVLLGCAFLFLVNALYPLSVSQAPAVAGAFAISCVIGYLVIFVPGGIGVREASLMTILTGLMPFPAAMAVAVISRPWYSILEALTALCALTTQRTKEAKRSSETTMAIFERDLG